MKKWLITLTFLLIATCEPTQAKYIRCNQANSHVEQMICDEKGNPGLSALDILLSKFFDAARSRLAPSEFTELVRSQKKWLKESRDVCKDADCVRQAYRRRLEELTPIATLCGEKEIVVYSCALPAQKVVSLCASSDVTATQGYLQFRLGRQRNALEKEFPKLQSPAKDYFKYHYRRYDDSHFGVSFRDGDLRWSVFSFIGKNADDRYGLIVDKPNATDSEDYSECKMAPLHFFTYEEYSSINISTIGDLLSLPPAHFDIKLRGGN